MNNLIYLVFFKDDYGLKEYLGQYFTLEEAIKEYELEHASYVRCRCETKDEASIYYFTSTEVEDVPYAVLEIYIKDNAN